MSERVIVSLTTWSARIGNIPAVLDTIFNQTIQPDLVVLNIAYDLIIPDAVNNYLEEHNVEVFRCEDTKVYKKLIPTLKRYPNDCVISIDDDWLYPQGMIEDFVEVHKLCPDNPISGNQGIINNRQCHCGCASLTKYSFFGDNLNMFDKELFFNCPCDDIAYTYFANKSYHPYIRTRGEYYTNMIPYNQLAPYSNLDVLNDKSLEYLLKRFGAMPDFIDAYVKNELVSNTINSIYTNSLAKAEFQAELKIRSTKSYKLGKLILKPLRTFCRLF